MPVLLRRAVTAPPILADLGLGLLAVAATTLLLQAWLAHAPAWLGGAVGAYLALALAVYRCWPRKGSGFGWPNRVTLLRGVLVAIVAGALALPELLARQGTLFAGLALLAIVLDGVDGWLARLRGSATAFGARFDMEVDALLILVLSAAVVTTGRGPAWVLAIGAMRYLFLLGGRLAPWWRRELPPSRWRKVVCVTQGVVLAGALLPWLTGPASELLLAAALALLLDSFGRDARWLVRHRGAPEGRD